MRYENYGKNLALQALRIYYNLHDSHKGNEKADDTLTLLCRISLSAAYSRAE